MFYIAHFLSVLCAFLKKYEVNHIIVNTRWYSFKVKYHHTSTTGEICL